MSFDIFPGLGMHCFVDNFDYMSQVVSITITPIIIGGILLAAGLFMLAQGNKKNAQRCAYSFFVLTYLVLISVSSTLFHVFKCRSFDEGGMFLYADYSVDCHSQHCKFLRFQASYELAMVLSFSLVFTNKCFFTTPPIQTLRTEDTAF